MGLVEVVRTHDPLACGRGLIGDWLAGNTVGPCISTSVGMNINLSLDNLDMGEGLSSQ